MTKLALHIFAPRVVEALATAVRSNPPDKVYRFPISQKALDKLPDEVLRDYGEILREHTEQRHPDEPTLFDSTLALRRSLAKENLWENEQRRVALARWIVTDWGKVDRRAKDNDGLVKLIRAADSAHRCSKPFLIDRPATWTKYLAFRYPRERAIYDARVAYSLNWLLMKSRAEKVFPFLQSENTLLGALDYRMWLATRMLGEDEVRRVFEMEIKKQSVKSRAVSKCMVEIEVQGDYYSEYCALLQNVGLAVFGKDDDWALTKVEMALFGMATTTIAREVLGETLKSAEHVMRPAEAAA